MAEVGSMSRFPDLEKHDNATLLVAEAERAIADLRHWTQPYLGPLLLGASRSSLSLNPVSSQLGL
jgi:hypothetical protein